MNTRTSARTLAHDESPVPARRSRDGGAAYARPATARMTAAVTPPHRSPRPAFSRARPRSAADRPAHFAIRASTITRPTPITACQAGPAPRPVTFTAGSSTTVATNGNRPSMASIMTCTDPSGSMGRRGAVLRWSTVRFVHRLPPGIARSLPLVPPVLALGATFGLLAEPVMGRVAPIVMSCIVFAGGAQFAALGVLAAGGGAVAAALAGTCVNLRFLPTGFAVAPALKGGRFRRAVEGQTVVDASFVLAARGDGTFDRPMLLASTAVQAFAWITGTVLGVLAAHAVPDPERFGLDAILPAFFLALLVGSAARARPARGRGRCARRVDHSRAHARAAAGPARGGRRALRR